MEVNETGRRVTSYAVVQTRFVGYHRWDEAPDHVSHLRETHRHEFHVKVKVEQFHDDREVEYLTLKREVDDILETFPSDLGESSCEMIAKDIIYVLHKRYDNDRDYRVEVFEDGENGAVVEVE